MGAPSRRLVSGGYAPVKRALDLALVSLVAIVAVPIGAVIAAAIKLEDGGRVLFRQERIGRHGVPFEIVKFRTLVDSPPREPVDFLIAEKDPRITKVGAFLRRSSLDELPQLWNVLVGEMSIVGPRPTLRYQVERYDDRQRRRLEVLPGITGWAQIHGRAALSWDERIELDVWYVDHRSPKTDLLILLRTPLALFGGTYKGSTGGWKG
jgi:lipopolysaccharide/colanic/teichoic acid biosynthesis glycosyltransferase